MYIRCKYYLTNKITYGKALVECMGRTFRQVVTLNATNILIKPAQSVKKSFLENLNLTNGFTHVNESATPYGDSEIRAEKAFYHALVNKDSVNLSFTEDSSAWWESVVNSTFRNGLAIDIHPKDKRLYRVLYNYYTRVDAWRLLPGAAALCKRLQEGRCLALRIGAISNLDKHIDGILTGLRVRDSFDFVIGAKSQKTDTIFSKAQWAGALTSPTHAIHIGSDFERDIVGGLKAGWGGVIWVRSDLENENYYPESKFPELDWSRCIEVQCLEDIPAYLGIEPSEDGPKYEQVSSRQYRRLT